MKYKRMNKQRRKLYTPQHKYWGKKLEMQKNFIQMEDYTMLETLNACLCIILCHILYAHSRFWNKRTTLNEEIQFFVSPEMLRKCRYSILHCGRRYALILPITMHIHNFGKIHLVVLKILSGNKILTNQVSDRQTTRAKSICLPTLKWGDINTCNPILDHPNINANAKFGQIPSICSQDIERKQNSDVNKGTQLCCKFVKIDA